jgi:hypothetical protein
VFAGYCGNCADHALVGPAHDLLALTRNDVEVAHLGAGWLYSPGTSGTLISGGAVVFKGGVNLGLATQKALGQLPAAADAIGASSSWLQVAQGAVSLDGFYGARVGGASGIPKNPWGFGVNLSASWTVAKLVAAVTGG